MKKVALALSSGGPRGFAYIGAIEELIARGYEITSIAGTSAGSLVGGIYAAGGLDAFKEWLYGLDPVKVVSLMDFSISKNYLVKGERVIRAIKERVPEVNIEDLPIHQGFHLDTFDVPAGQDEWPHPGRRRDGEHLSTEQGTEDRR